jgi:alpha-ribazole phosphatase
MEVYLIRHPKPARCEGLCYGRNEVPVHPDVLATAAASVRSLIPACVLRQAAMFTSPASRCLGLARELAAPREPCIAEELHEMHFGTWEGLPWESVPREELDAWAADMWSYRAGGGESTAMVAQRWRGWCKRVAVQIGGRGLPAVAVTHAGLIRVALAGARDLGATLLIDAPFGSVHRIEIDALEAETP